MSGYQEVLTDPSYNSQIVTMTYPLIGNYGVNAADVESSRVQVSGFVVKQACRYPSNFTSTMSIGDYLKKQGIIGIEGIDTRAVTRKLRISGALKGIVTATVCSSQAGGTASESGAPKRWQSPLVARRRYPSQTHSPMFVNFSTTSSSLPGSTDQGPCMVSSATKATLLSHASPGVGIPVGQGTTVGHGGEGTTGFQD